MYILTYKYDEITVIQVHCKFHDFIWFHKQAPW